MARFVFDGVEMTPEEFNKKSLLKKTGPMFNRAEALQNAAKAIKGLRALDDDALETLYLEAKAERRERNKLPVIEPGMQAASVTFAGPQTAADVKALKDLALTLSKEKPDAQIEHMHVLEDGDIEVTFADGVALFRQD